MLRFRPACALVLLTALTACTIQIPVAPPSPPSPAEGGASDDMAPVRPASRQVITGVVTAPIQLVSGNGGSIIAPGGGNYRLQAVSEQALVGAEVFLADPAGTPYPGLPSVKTDDRGRFVLPDVPPDFTFIVAVRAKTRDGREAQLRTLCRSSALGATADVSTATTLLTTGIAQGNGKMLGQFNPATFKQAVDAVRERLRDDDMPDLADTAAVVARMNRLAAETEAIKAAVEELKRDLAEIKASLDELKAKIEELKREPGPTPTPPAQPTPSPTPQPTGTPAPSATPTPMPTPTPTPTPETGSTTKAQYKLSGKVTTDNGAGYPVAVRFAPRLDLDADGGAGGQTTSDAAGNWSLALEVGTDQDARYEIFFKPEGGEEVSRGTFRLYTDGQTLSAYNVPGPTPDTGSGNPVYTLSGKVSITNNSGSYPVKVRFAPRLDLDADGGPGSETTTDAAGNWSIDLEVGSDKDARFEIFYTPTGGSEISRGTFRLYTDDQALNPHDI